MKAESPWMIYDVVKAHYPRAGLWAPSDGKNGPSDALDWASDVFGDYGLAMLAGGLYLVTGLSVRGTGVTTCFDTHHPQFCGLGFQAFARHTLLK